MKRKPKGRTGIVVQARMNSSRLQGKVLKDLLGKPMLSHQIERVRRVKNADEIIIATTTGADDQAIVDLCAKLGVRVFRGSEEDVLSRYYGAAGEARLDYVVRITADCPLIDPDTTQHVIEQFLADETVDYASNAITRSFPRGLDTEIMTFKALSICQHEAMKPYEREHVTPFIYTHPERFNIKEIISPENLSKYRWTVDTNEDFLLVQKIYEALYAAKPHFTLQDCLELMRLHPEWAEINAGVKQKKYWETA